jgi:predicted metal-dependent hydrolase
MDIIKDIKIDKIIRTKRKTIALQMTEDATLIVRAPLNVSHDAIIKTVLKYENWIKQKKIKIQSREHKFVPKKFVNGEDFIYLGDIFKLEIVDNQFESLRFNDKFYLAKNALPVAKEVFIAWYKHMANLVISERTKLFADINGLQYNKISITNAQKRWGSCSFYGNLCFSWRLVMAPAPVIDYVVIHELSHLKEKNHQEDFWNRVRTFMPDYKNHNDWLKENSHFLRL